MPLELRSETEAYRLCQPMHVLSFGEGLLFEFFTFTGGMAFRVLGYKLQGRRKFSCDYLIYFAPPRLRDATMVYEAIRLEIESCFPLSLTHVLAPSGKWMFVCCSWVSGLGIGFWLRGVQPRTTLR